MVGQQRALSAVAAAVALFGAVQAVTSDAVDVNDAGCVVVTDAAAQQDVKLEAHGPNSIRVRAVRSGKPFRDDLVSALVPQQNDGHDRLSAGGSCRAATLGADEGPPELTVGNLKAAVGAEGRLVFTRVSDGKVLVQEKTVRDLRPTETTPPVPGFDSLTLEFEPIDGERLYGLGQHASLPWDPSGSANGQLDMKGYGSLLLAPHDGEIVIPVVHSSVGYAFLFNLPSLGNVEYNSSVSYWHAEAVLQADFWVTTTSDGPTHAVSPWQQLQANYAHATGFAPVWPEWTTGFWQCKLRYSNQSQIMDVAREFVRRNIPISLIIIDFYSWNDPKGNINTLGDETLPKTCWPDPKGMVDELKSLGIELMISPYSHSVANSSHNYAGAASKGLLATDETGGPALGYAGGFVYDLFNPAAREYAWDDMRKGYVDQYGLHHWWLDCNEPCGGTNNGSFANNWLYNNGTWPASLVGAAYPSMVARMIYEGEGAPGRIYEHDNVMLGRSAWAGDQRYGAATWSGDTKSTWNDLNQQFRAGLNMVMSGIPYWTSDIGGFGGANIEDPDFRELIVRWFQWGAFCPIFRLHGARSGPHWPPGPSGECGATASNEVWMFGNESYDAIVSVMRIREKLRPYVLEQYKAASINGTPIMRPLFYDFYEDAAAKSVDDELMFGHDYLLAPILAKGAESRTVYLPKLPQGEVWINFFTNKSTEGGRNITEAAPIRGSDSVFPLYKRTPAEAIAEE